MFARGTISAIAVALLIGGWLWSKTRNSQPTSQPVFRPSETWDPDGGWPW